jgi:hypothetical protein
VGLDELLRSIERLAKFATDVEVPLLRLVLSGLSLVGLAYVVWVMLGVHLFGLR